MTAWARRVGPGQWTPNPPGIAFGGAAAPSLRAPPAGARALAQLCLEARRPHSSAPSLSGLKGGLEEQPPRAQVGAGGRSPRPALWSEHPAKSPGRRRDGETVEASPRTQGASGQHQEPASFVFPLGPQCG